MENYFLEVRDLRFDSLEDDAENNEIREIVAGWYPKGKGVFARLTNRRPGKSYFDYIVITEDLIYFAILFEGSPPVLRSIKCFKSGDMLAFAFILEALDKAGEGSVPQMRLMLRDGKLLRLIMSDENKDAVLCKMQELSTKHFFAKS